MKPAAIFAATFGVLLLYLVSMPFAVWVIDRTPLNKSERALKVFYSVYLPAITLHETVPKYHDFLEWESGVINP